MDTKDGIYSYTHHYEADLSDIIAAKLKLSVKGGEIKVAY